MVREPDATMQPTLQDNQLLSKHRVLSFKPQLRLERRGQDGQHETKQPDHYASLGDSITSSTQTRFSVHTTGFQISPSLKCHVWTAPAVQEESDISAKRSGAARYPAFECSRYGRWP